MHKDGLNRSGVTLRSIAIGLVLIVVNAHWLTLTSELMEPQFLLTFVSLFFNAVFTLFVVAAINGFVTWVAPRHALTAQEQLVIYIMVVMVSTIGGHTTMTFLIGTIAHPFRFATPENEWSGLFLHYIPRWFTPSPDALDGYFEGASTLYTARHIRGWLTPILVWSAFIAVIWFTLICINTLIRAQWTEREKLAYPIIQLPVQMTAGASFWRSRAMWAGFAVAGILELLAGLHHLFPKVPALRLTFYSISHLFTEKPWNSIGGISLSAYPFIIGLTFFVPLDISFSAWVFYFVGKAERIIRLGMLGTSKIYFDERGAGAWNAVGVLALWGMRHQLVQVGRRIAGLSTPVDDSREPMRYRTAVIGIVVGLGFLALFSYQAGMSTWGIVGFMALYLAMGLGFSRVRAEFGPPTHEILWVDPARLLAVSFGPRRLGSANLTILSLYYWLNRLNVSHPMPNQLEAFKIAERRGINNKHLVWVMMFATVVGTLACFWSYLHVMYRDGASSASGFIVGIGDETFERLGLWLSQPGGPDNKAVGSMQTGFLITLILYFLRHRYLWWPFHPIGYVMTSATYGGLADFWFSVFIGWAIKFVIVGLFGLGVHRRAAPFFLGLVLGDYVATAGWSLVGTFFDAATYVIWSP